jgi:hypothetical protein
MDIFHYEYDAFFALSRDLTGTSPATTLDLGAIATLSSLA